jgi:hypothetical protein
MSAWSTFLQTAKKKISDLDREGCDMPFFRGQTDSAWKLLPSLERYKLQNARATANPEEDLYFDFVTQAGALLPEDSGSWSIAFQMQHYGLPTRLLDWTETFSVALYFAIKNATDEAAIWILDPFRLNKATINIDSLINPTELSTDYAAYFIERTATLEGNVVAMSPLRHNPRVMNQRAGFTLHDDLKNPLEVLHPDTLIKLILPKEAFPEAWKFVELAGINEFTLFPDLDGLARHLKRKYFKIKRGT